MDIMDEDYEIVFKNFMIRATKRKRGKNTQTNHDYQAQMWGNKTLIIGDFKSSEKIASSNFPE